MTIQRILALDGGGIRGVLSARLLTRLTEEEPGWLDRVDLFAGTSTGALLAAGLAAGLPPSELTELYVEHADTIFDPRFPGFVLSGGYASKARYHNRALREILEDKFHGLGFETLGDLSRRVLLASFDLAHPATGDRPATWAPKFFHNFPRTEDDADRNDRGEKIVEVLLRSGAAPTYFPSFGTFVDGGVVANNPSMCALAQALGENHGESLGDIKLLSLGTGLNVRQPLPRDNDWGWMQWAFRLRPSKKPPYEKPILQLLLEGSVDLARYQCEQLLGQRFRRLDPILPEAFELDDVGSVPQLLKVADQVPLEATVEWLRSEFLAESGLQDTDHGSRAA